MKKILAMSLCLVFIAGSAFATTSQLANNTVAAAAAITITGGADSGTVGVNALGKMSTGVFCMVNYESATAKMSSSYAIFTKHTNGSKVFGTASDSTNVWWKASPSKVKLTADECGAGNSNSNFGTAGSWTSY